MSAYTPPIENIPIFDTLLFRKADSNFTQAEADARYLRYPIAQGTETLQGVNILGSANITGALTCSSTASFTSTTPPTSSQTIPASNDSSTKIPTTAWVQSAISGGSTTKQTIAYFRTGLVAGNVAPLTTPLTIVVSPSFTGTGITMCPLLFRITCNLTNGLPSSYSQDSNGVSTFCNTATCLFNYFPFCSQPVVSSSGITNINYLTNGIGNTTTNTAYYCPTAYGNATGRPFWTTALQNEGNVATLFPFTFTGLTGVNGVKTIVFNPPAVGYPASSTFFWEWTIEVKNSGYFANTITSTGFTQNLNC